LIRNFIQNVSLSSAPALCFISYSKIDPAHTCDIAVCVLDEVTGWIICLTQALQSEMWIDSGTNQLDAMERTYGFFCVYRD